MVSKTALYWYAKDASGKWSRHACEVVRENGFERMPRFAAIKKDYPTGYFVLRQYGSEQKWITLRDGAGRTIDEPVLAMEHRRNVNRNASKVQVAAKKNDDQARVDVLYKLDSAIESYIDHLTRKDATEAAVQARLVLKEFMVVCGRAGITRTQDIRAEHLNAYMADIEQKGNSDRTRANKHDRVMIFAKWVNTKAAENGAQSDRINVSVLRTLAPRPKFDTNAEVKTYSRSQIEALLNAADDYMTVVLNLGLRLGLREQEIMHAEWSDVNWTARTIRVQNKEHLGFKTKTQQSRTVPLGPMVDLLKEWRSKRSGTRLIVGTASDNPNTHLLRALKRMAKNAGLNCGQCAGCKSAAQECRLYGLHSLRRTYCTGLFRGKRLDDKSIMEYMGHRDLETTLRYRDAVRAEEKRAQEAVAAIDFGD